MATATPLRTAAVLAAATVVCLLAGCGEQRADGDPAAAGWTHRDIVCTQVTGATPTLLELDAGDTTTVDTEVLTAAACTEPGSSGPLELDDEHTFHVVATGTDRARTTLDGVNVDDETVVAVTHHQPGSGCIVDTLYTGELLALLEGPADAATPTVQYRTSDESC